MHHQQLHNQIFQRLKIHVTEQKFFFYFQEVLVFWVKCETRFLQWADVCLSGRRVSYTALGPRQPIATINHKHRIRAVWFGGLIYGFVVLTTKRSCGFP